MTQAVVIHRQQAAAPRAIRAGQNAVLRTALTLVELMVVIAIVGVLLALLLPAVQSVREAARRANCQNNLHQIGIALHQYHDVRKSLPSGWIAGDRQERPGWGWASQILPFMEEGNRLLDRRAYSVAIADPQFDQARKTPIHALLCPSDAAPDTIIVLLGETDETSQAIGRIGSLSTSSVAPRFSATALTPSPTQTAIAPPVSLELARSSYAAVFGTQAIEDVPQAGNGSFFRNSRIRFQQITDGLTRTMFVGERSNRQSDPTWVGTVAPASRALARVVGTVDKVPNDVLAHVADYSSVHVGGANFLFGDSSVRMIGDDVDIRVYRGMATRAGGEPDQPTGPADDDHNGDDNGPAAPPTAPPTSPPPSTPPTTPPPSDPPPAPPTDPPPAPPTTPPSTPPTTPPAPPTTPPEPPTTPPGDDDHGDDDGDDHEEDEHGDDDEHHDDEHEEDDHEDHDDDGPDHD